MLSAMAELRSSGDREYLDLLFRSHYEMLCKLVRPIIRDESAEGDIVTNAMLSLFSKVDFLRSLSDRRRTSYLRATARNAAYKYYNAGKIRGVTEFAYNDLLFSLPAPEHDDPYSVLLDSEELRLVRDAIAILPEGDRILLHLKYAALLTSSEIAELITAPSAAAVRERLVRARHKVLMLLEQRGWGNE